MNKKKEKSSKKLKFKRKTLIISLIVLFVILTAIILIVLIKQSIIDNPLGHTFFKEEEIIVEDKCSLIVGRIIHSIQDSDTCKFLCQTNCKVSEKSMTRFEFTLVENNCNKCLCFCK